MSMGKTVREMLGSMDALELTEWFAYMRIETLPQDRADLCAGIVASATANFGSRQIRKPYRAADFMPYLNRQESGPVLLADKDKQSALIMKACFNKTV